MSAWYPELPFEALNVLFYPVPLERIHYSSNFVKPIAKEGNTDCFLLDYLNMDAFYDGFLDFLECMILLVSFFYSFLVFACVHYSWKKHVGEVNIA